MEELIKLLKAEITTETRPKALNALKLILSICQSRL